MLAIDYDELLPQVKPAPKYDHAENKVRINEAIKRTKFQFKDQEIHFDLIKEYNQISANASQI